MRTLRWRPSEGEGLEHMTIRATADGVIARSVVIGERGGRPYGVHYRVGLDADWTVRSLDLDSTAGDALSVRSDGAGHWRDADGAALPEFDGCFDIDLAGSPFTNTLPIRRLGERLGAEPVELAMLFVPFDTFAPFVDRQFYSRLPAKNRYRFRAADGSFAADILTDDDGFVLDYPPLFARSDRT